MLLSAGTCTGAVDSYLILTKPSSIIIFKRKNAIHYSEILGIFCGDLELL